jgi:hypothetical protein
VLGEMGAPGAAALQPLLAACTLAHIALDVSGEVVADGAGESKGAHASAILADGLKRNSVSTSMRLVGVHASDVAGLISASRVLSKLDISNNQFGAEGAECIAMALKTNTCCALLNLYVLCCN